LLSWLPHRVRANGNDLELGYGLACSGNIQFLQDFYPFHAIDSRMQKLDIDAAETGYFAGIDLPTMESPSK